jgi:hypothetical protein
VTVNDELQARALFDARYGIALPPVARQIERRVIGGDWGANGYTTIPQADTLARGLGLSATDRLLDIGTGRVARPVPGGHQRLPGGRHRPAPGIARGRRPRRGRGPCRPRGHGGGGRQRAALSGR